MATPWILHTYFEGLMFLWLQFGMITKSESIQYFNSFL